MTNTTQRLQYVLDRLSPFAAEHGLQWLARQSQFRAREPYGFRSLIVSVSHYAQDSMVELHLGLRNDLIETTAFRYTDGLTVFAPDSLTLVASTAKLRGLRTDRHLIATEADADRVMRSLLTWIGREGPAFWERYASLGQIDAALNHQPEAPTYLIPNAQLRCFRGLVAARYAQRPGWEQLIPVYRRELQRLYATPALLHGYVQLATFLRSYLPN